MRPEVAGVVKRGVFPKGKRVGPSGRKTRRRPKAESREGALWRRGLGTALVPRPAKGESRELALWRRGLGTALIPSRRRQSKCWGPALGGVQKRLA